MPANRDIDKFSQKASSMEDGDILSQTSIETYITTGLECSFEEVYTQKAEEFDLQRLNILSWNCVPPLYSPREHYSVFPDPRWEQCYSPVATGATVLSPWHISGASVQVNLIPGVSDGNLGDIGGGFGLTNDLIWANGSRPGRMPVRVTGQEDFFRGTNPPYNQGNGNDVHLRNPNLLCTASDSQSPLVSPQQAGTHLNSPFEHHPDQRAEAPESNGFQLIPAVETAQGSRIRFISSKEWPCGRNGCDKSYGRPQDVRRHVREKHAILPECLFCGIKWTRAEMIRRHLIKKHRDHFTKKERQQILHLQGLKNTINFLSELEITML